uniref:Uncharacterized protein n=1 Tax=Rhizophora mucronata TaxID=61149 RepID=A0A2P2LLW1_RHIMU
MGACYNTIITFFTLNLGTPVKLFRSCSICGKPLILDIPKCKVGR